MSIKRRQDIDLYIHLESVKRKMCWWAVEAFESSFLYESWGTGQTLAHISYYYKLATWNISRLESNSITQCLAVSTASVSSFGTHPRRLDDGFLSYLHPRNSVFNVSIPACPSILPPTDYQSNPPSFKISGVETYAGQGRRSFGAGCVFRWSLNSDQEPMSSSSHLIINIA